MTYEEAKNKLEELECVVGDSDDIVLPDLLALQLGQKSLEKQMPKKPVYNCIRRALCPVCDGELYPKFLYVRRFKHQEMRIEEKMPYCKHCGQALDWGKTK